jgi:cation transport ATPase
LLQSRKIQQPANEIMQARTRLEANDQVIEQQKARLDQAIADFQKQFSTAESTRASEFATSASRMQAEYASQLKTLSEQWATNAMSKEREWAAMVQQASEQADQQTRYFEGRRAEVDKIFGAIGSASLAGHFAKTADDDSKAANQLRRIALGLMCLMIVVAVFSFYQSLIHPEIDWKIFLFRLATVLVIAIPALYAAQESNKHRYRERHNRKMQVELASIDAYLVKLPTERQNELKAKLTERFFGQPEVADREEPITKHQLLELVADVLKNLTRPK